MRNFLTRFFALITVVMAAALAPGVSGQGSRPAASPSQPQASIGAGAHIQSLRPGFCSPDIWRSERGIRVAAAWPAHFRLTANGQSFTDTSRRSGFATN